MKIITAELITIGDEILYGQTLDTNTHWMSQQLGEIGVRVVKRLTIGDNEPDILRAFREAHEDVDIVLITGGLGPTNDDLTKPLLAKYFGVGLELNEDALQDVSGLFKKLGRELTELNRQQAVLPVNCTKVTNKMGTAPGMWFDENDTVFVSMPGVPYEMKHMMTHEILPKLTERFHTPTIVHRMIKTVGIGESWLADKIKDWEDALPEHIRLAYLPSLGQVKMRLTATGENPDALNAEIDQQVEQLKEYAADYIYGYSGDEIESVIGRMLSENRQTIATAESCTGGRLANAITSIAGSSDYFKGSVIAYDNSIKTSILGVKESTLAEHGAVSEQTVVEMSRNVREVLGTDVGVATSGIAGPGGGTTEKPVGTIWIAVSDRFGTKTRLLKYGKDRKINIEYTTVSALNLIRQRLHETNGKLEAIR